MTAKNDITGDPIVNTKGDYIKYSEGWKRIFGDKSSSKQNEKDFQNKTIDESKKNKN